MYDRNQVFAALRAAGYTPMEKRVRKAYRRWLTRGAPHKSGDFTFIQEQAPTLVKREVSFN